MNRSKLIAIITGAISIILAIAYLIIVQLLDFRGEMLPAPQSQLPQTPPQLPTCCQTKLARSTLIDTRGERVALTAPVPELR